MREAQENALVQVRYGDLMTLCANAVVTVTDYGQYAKPRRRGPDPFFTTRMKDFVRVSELAQKVAWDAKSRT